MALRPRIAALAVVVGAVWLPSAAWARAGAPPPAGTVSQQWPPAPLPARVKFVRTVSPETVRGRPSFFTRLVGLIVGGWRQPHMEQPYGVAVGPDARIYVADTFGRAVHVFDLDKGSYSSIKVDGDSLIGVAIAGGRLFVTDSASGRVLGLDLKGHKLWTLDRRDGFERPTGLAAAPDRLYVVDTMRHRVVAVSLDGKVLGGFGERGAAAGQFNFPTNIARGGDGRLYVTDSMNFRVQVFDADGGFLRTFGQLGDGSGDFDKPRGVAVDSDGHVYVVEALNDVVQIFDEAGRLLLAFGGSGSADGQLWLPAGIAISRDAVYVADSANRRIEVFEYVRAPQ